MQCSAKQSESNTLRTGSVTSPVFISYPFVPPSISVYIVKYIRIVYRLNGLIRILFHGTQFTSISSTDIQSLNIAINYATRDIHSFLPSKYLISIVCGTYFSPNIAVLGYQIQTLRLCLKNTSDSLSVLTESL